MAASVPTMPVIPQLLLPINALSNADAYAAIGNMMPTMIMNTGNERLSFLHSSALLTAQRAVNPLFDTSYAGASMPVGTAAVAAAPSVYPPVLAPLYPSTAGAIDSAPVATTVMSHPSLTGNVFHTDILPTLYLPTLIGGSLI